MVIWCEVRVKAFFFLHMDFQLLIAWYLEKNYPFSTELPLPLCPDQLSTCLWLFLDSSVLLICLFFSTSIAYFFHYCNLINLEIRWFFFSKFVLDILVHLYCHMKYRITWSISKKEKEINPLTNQSVLLRFRYGLQWIYRPTWRDLN